MQRDPAPTLAKQGENSERDAIAAARAAAFGLAKGLTREIANIFNGLLRADLMPKFRH